MAQGNKPRHSKPARKPVTIDLPPEDVSEEKAQNTDAGTGAGTGPKASGVKAEAPSGSGQARSESAASPKPSAEPGKGEAKAKSASPISDAVKSEPDKPASDKAGTVKAAGSVPKAGADKKSKEPTAGKDSDQAGKATGSSARPAGSASSAQPSAPSGATGSSSSAGRTFGVGLAAAVVAVVLFGGLQYAGVLPVPGGGSDDGAGAIVTSDIAALKQSVASLEQQSTGDATGVVQGLETRIAALESSTEAGAGDAGDRISALEKKVEAMTGSGSGAQSGADSGALKALGDRVAALEKALSDGQAPLEGVDSKLTTLEQGLNSQQSALQGIQGTLSSLDQKVAGEAQSREAAVKTIDDRLTKIEASLSAPRQDMRVARALAAANLKAAIDRGGPFMAELEAYASVDGDSPVIEPLRSLAASGVPTRAALMARFSGVAKAMIDASRGDGASGNVFNRLMDSASSLVTVRPVGEVSGDSVEAIVARMENRLKNGDLQGAINEWNTLPKAAQDASAAYVKDLKARMEAESLITGSLNAALPAAVQSGEAN